jgi:hypothetical protein
MGDLNVEKLLEALDVETNENIMNLTTAKIKEMNLKILKELQLTKKNTLELFKKLNGYKYVDEMNDLKSGTYLRWIPLNLENEESEEDYYLTKGAVFCELKVTDEGLNIVLKNYGFSNKHFTIKMDDNIVFQKLTSQELVILSALDHLSN